MESQIQSLQSTTYLSIDTLDAVLKAYKDHLRGAKNSENLTFENRDVLMAIDDKYVVGTFIPKSEVTGNSLATLCRNQELLDPQKFPSYAIAIAPKDNLVFYGEDASYDFLYAKSPVSADMVATEKKVLDQYVQKLTAQKDKTEWNYSFSKEPYNANKHFGSYTWANRR